MIGVSPRSLDAAISALAGDPDLVPIAGCTDVMVGTAQGSETAVASRAARPASGVIDLRRIPELRGIASGDVIDIGAAVTFTELRTSPDIARHFPILAEAAGVVGGWQIQNRATIGGNIANASPAGDSLPVLLALDARVVIAGPAGLREVPYDEFHVGYRKTMLQPAELIVRVRIPVQPNTVQRFRKVGTREAQAISKVVVAMAARVERGTIAALRLGAGSVADRPVRLRQAEQAGTGQPANLATAAMVARAARSEVHPIDDVRSTAAYRAFALERVVRWMMTLS